ncbi:unnamed protein product [Hymenolepis diminuta]|uniref:Cadherin domain-containing protein n=1 Tax=Hymenolepis diminuta TaxID=6216 RepID=A0A0R3ST45_HYMDI|nr:unnamed protein product [Hymenolepis diminuta]
MTLSTGISTFLLFVLLLLLLGENILCEVIELQIGEEMPMGSIIADLRSLISKGGKFASDSQWATFKSAGSDDIGNRLVDVTPEGKLLVSHQIDREKLCPLYPLSMFPGSQPGFGGTLTGTFGLPGQSGYPINLGSGEHCAFTLRVAVIEKSEGNNPLDISNIYQIRITVLDINDQAPFWPENLQRHVIEFRDGDPPGKRQSLPLAFDLDQGENARISYTLEQDPTDDTPSDGWNSTPFKLIYDHSEESLYLQAEREIDHEVASSYKLILKATDGVDKSIPDSMTSDRYLRQHTSTLSLTVVVQDINDNDPKFTQPVFTPDRSVSEATPVGSVILRLKATDADSGENGNFHFDFAPNAGWRSTDMLAQYLFDVRPNGNVVVKNPLDVDKQWKLVDDLKKGSNPVIYGGDNSRGMELSFKVMVVDEADPRYARSSEATVNIFVMDENDEAPTIEVMRPATSSECVKSLGKPAGIPTGRSSPQTSYACVFENAPIDTFVATIQVSDLDARGEDEHECILDNKNFSLIAEEHANTRLSASQITHVFNGQTSKGPGASQYAILTAAALDREATLFQRIQIICSDHASHQSIHNLTVLIGDINDHKPQFTQEVMTYQVPENSPPGTILKQVSTRNAVALATDADVGKNGMIKYSFIRGSRAAENFSIDPFSGLISTRIPLDREMNGKYAFNILAIDQGEGETVLTGTGTVEVLVLDVNDNPPEFTQELYTFQIAENLPRGTRVGQVTAFDLDDQGHVSYYLSDDHDALVFQIDRSSGELSTRRPLDREDQSNYTFKVLVRDQSVPGGGTEKNSFTATASVTVVLEDENDNSPVFVLPNNTANTLSVAVSQTLGHKLADIIATDADEGDNGRVTYKIKAGNSLNLFSIDPQSGLLFLADSLTRFSENTNGSNADEATSARALQLATQPTVHVITLEACDSGVEPRCTVSPNLRIHVQPERKLGNAGENNRMESSAYGSGNSDQEQFGEGSQEVGADMHSQTSDNTSGDERMAGWNGIKSNSAHAASGGMRSWTSGSNEIIIICMSVLFVIILVTILALTLLLRNRKSGTTKQMTVSATHQSLSRSKTLTYLGGATPSSQFNSEVVDSFSAQSSQALGQTPVVGGGVIQSQSEMLLCRRGGANLLPQSQSFFEMPKSMTQEFTTFVPANLDGRTMQGKKQANAARSADLLIPLKYAHHDLRYMKALCPDEGEYQALQANGLYTLDKNLEEQQRHTVGQNKVFAQNMASVARFLTQTGRPSVNNDDSFPMYRVVEGHPQNSYTYGRYMGMKPNQPVASHTIDARIFEHQQQSQQQFSRPIPQRLYVRDFPRSKSAHAVANPVIQGATKSEGSGESSEGGEESMLLLLPEAEGRSEISEPLSASEERQDGAISSPESQQQQMNNFNNNVGGTRKLVSSAYREASFV